MRRSDLDNIRWVTVLLVVAYHVVYIFNGVTQFGIIGPFHAHQLQDSLLYLLSPWFMSLMFVVSGISARLELQKRSPMEFFRARTRRYLVPATLGLLVFHWTTGFWNILVGGGLEHMSENVPGFVFYLILCLSGTGVLWYLQMLWLFSAVLALLRRFESGRLHARLEQTGLPVLLALAVPFFLAGTIGNPPLVTVYRFGLYSFCFAAGYFVFCHDAVVERLSRYALPLAAAAAVLGVGYTVYFFGENYALDPCLTHPFTALYGWAAILAVLACMRRYANRTGPIARWFARRSFGLYVFHCMPLSAAAWLLTTKTILGPVPVYLLTALAAFGGGWLLWEIIHRIPVLRWCVLGIGGKENRHVS